LDSIKDAFGLLACGAIVLFSDDDRQLKEFYQQLPHGVTVKNYARVKKKVDKLVSEGVKNFDLFFNEHPEIASTLIEEIEFIDVNDAMLKLFKVDTLREFVRLATNADHWSQNTDRLNFYLTEILDLIAGRKHCAEFQGYAADETPIAIRCISWIPSLGEKDWSVVFTTHEDIIERQKTEKSLKDSESWMNTILDNAPIEIALKDCDGKIVGISRTVANEFGYNRKDFIGLTTADFLSPEVAKVYMDADQEVIKTGKLVQQEVIEETDSGPRYLLSAKFPIRDLGGAISGVCSLTSDISEIRQTGEALKVALAEAEQANLAKSKFLANMSHELRTPLNAIQGFAEIMNRQIFGDLGSEKYVGYAKDIETSSLHLLSLINDLLDLSAIEAGKHSLDKKQLDIADVVDDCSAIIFAAATRKDIRFSVELNEPIRPIFADNRALRQILLNLLTNAIKFTPRNGSVAFHIMDENENHIFQISDTGEGIPADRIADITAPFTRVETEPLQTQEGSGLGLAIVETLVDLHHGSLNINSVVGEGTTVTVTLPSMPK
jgi:PAS domain S-box-containing protein